MGRVTLPRGEGGGDRARDDKTRGRRTHARKRRTPAGEGGGRALHQTPSARTKRTGEAGASERGGGSTCGQRGGANSVWTMPGRELHQAVHDVDRPSTTAADQARHVHAMSRREAVGSRDARQPHHASPESVYAVSRATSRRGLGQCQSLSTGEKKSCARMSALIEDWTMLQRAPQSVFESEETV